MKKNIDKNIQNTLNYLEKCSGLVKNIQACIASLQLAQKMPTEYKIYFLGTVHGEMLTKKLITQDKLEKLMILGWFEKLEPCSNDIFF